MRWSRLGALVLVVVGVLVSPDSAPLSAECLEACCQARVIYGNPACPESECTPVYYDWGHCMCEQTEIIYPLECGVRQWCVTSGSWCYGIIIWG